MADVLTRQQQLAHMIQRAHERAGLEGDRTIGRAIRYYDVIGSTHRVATTAASGPGTQDGTIILAGKVLEAVGRFQRKWHAPEGGIWFTLIKQEQNPFYAMAAGIAVCEALREFVPAKTLWPNDVYIGSKKIAGILVTEYKPGKTLGKFSLIGAGVNVNNNMSQILQTATSIVQETGREVELDPIFANIVVQLRYRLGLADTFALDRLHAIDAGQEIKNPIVTRFKQLTDILGRRITYRPPQARGAPQSATAVDIDDQGRLLVASDGITFPLQAAEITLDPFGLDTS